MSTLLDREVLRRVAGGGLEVGPGLVDTGEVDRHPDQCEEDREQKGELDDRLAGETMSVRQQTAAAIGRAVRW